MEASVANIEEPHTAEPVGAYVTTVKLLEDRGTLIVCNRRPIFLVFPSETP